TYHSVLTLYSSVSMLLSFFSIIPPRPSSTLFPYTTLFRSGRHQVVQFLDPEHPDIPDRRGEPRETPGQIDRGEDAGHGIDLSRRDRKSTRLNSSHVAISYAVFCLKKKKKTSLQMLANQMRY